MGSRMIEVTGTACILMTICCIGLNLVQADDRKTATDLVRSRGFNVDEFDVVSQNYPLKIYRIINPLADPKQVQKIPVIAHHGISWDITNMMSSSKNSRPRKPKIDERVTLYAMENGTDDKGLYFYLSNNNYDIWMLEARATNERVKRRLTDGGNEKTFWDFSLDEQALIDLPVQIDFVLAKTGQKKAAYIAYSQSTTFMFALLSMRPEFNDKLITFIAMAPVVYTSHLKGLVWPTSISKIYFHTTTAKQTVPEWLRRMQNFVLTYLCSISYIKATLCRLMWQQFSGTDKKAELDGGMVENVLKSVPLKSFEQYVNNAMIKDFRMYDYKDEMRNMEEYGQPVPPQYNVSKITLKTIVLFRGTNDYLSDPQDQMILLTRLRVPLYEDHILEDYSHIDFIVSPTVTRDINEPILRVLDTLTERPVKRILHTLGNPNPEIQGTTLVTDVKSDMESMKGKVRKLIKSATFDAPSLPKQERLTGGVNNNPEATTVRDQLFEKDSMNKQQPQKQQQKP